MSWFEDNIIKNPIINPAGWVASKIREDNGGDAVERVENWSKNQQILPGCNYDPLENSANCVWEGTQADWEQYRTDWINNCVSANNRGILTSKNKTLAACQAKFDEMALGIRLEQVKKNALELQDVKDFIGKNNPFIYLFAFLFVALIIYLLMSE